MACIGGGFGRGARGGGGSRRRRRNGLWLSPFGEEDHGSAIDDVAQGDRNLSLPSALHGSTASLSSLSLSLHWEVDGCRTQKQ